MEIEKRFNTNGMSPEEIQAQREALGPGWEPVSGPAYVLSGTPHIVTGKSLNKRLRVTKRWISAVLPDGKLAMQYARALARETRNALQIYAETPDLRDRVNEHMRQFDPQFELGEPEVEYGIEDRVPPGVTAESLPKPIKALVLPAPYVRKR